MISGFDSDIAILLLAGAFLASAVFAWWSYAKQTEMPPAVRYLSSALRGLSVLILLILLFQPTVENEEVRELKQHIAVLFDTSKSTIIQKGNWDGESNYDSVISQLQLSDTTAIRYSVYGFDSDIFATTPDSLPFDGAVTDINESLKSLSQEPESFNAVLLVTDGIFNRGLDPTTTALRSGLPFYTLAIGDTIRQRDLLVRNVFYNPTAFTNSRIPIRVEILNDGFPDRNIDVQIWVDNELKETRTIFTNQNRSVHSEEFELSFEEEGTKAIRIRIPELDGEWTTSNNTYEFTIDVKDDQIRILHLAFEVHPDVGSLRNMLATDESIILKNLNWIRDNRFIGETLPATADTLDLIILHGFPHESVSKQLADQITALVSRTNIMLLPLSGTRHDRMTDYLSNIPPIRTTGPASNGGILPKIRTSEKDHPVLDIDETELSRAPELTGIIRNQQSASNTRTLLENTFRGSDTDIPTLVLSETGNQRVSQVNAWHWNRWQQSTQSEIRTFYRQLFNNIVKWTSANPDNNILTLTTSQQSYQDGNPVLFRANVRTDTGSPDTEARVEIRLSGDQTDESTFSMRQLGGGRFSLDVGSLPPGTYTYTGRSFRGNTETGEVRGSFTVTQSILELMDTTRRDGLLQFIAEESGGAFFTFNELDALREQFKNDGLLDFNTERFSTIERVHHSYWWFILVILLLSAEWTLRKKYDMA